MQIVFRGLLEDYFAERAGMPAVAALTSILHLLAAGDIRSAHSYVLRLHRGSWKGSWRRTRRLWRRARPTGRCCWLRPPRSC